MAWADGRLVMLVLPAPEYVDLERAKAMLNAQEVRRAREAEFANLFPDCDVGAMPPFGNMYHVPVYIDATLSDQSYIVFQAGSHRKTIKIAMSDYWRLATPTVGHFAIAHEARPVTA
jgi:Ala-tRNA(Pro) deacylase